MKDITLPSPESDKNFPLMKALQLRRTKRKLNNTKGRFFRALLCRKVLADCVNTMQYLHHICLK